MKFKSYLLAAALLLGGAGAAAVGISVTLAADEPLDVNAEFVEGARFAILGSLQNYSISWAEDNGMLVEDTEIRDGVTWYYIDLSLKANDQFKLVYQYPGADGKYVTKWLSSSGISFDPIYGWDSDGNFHVNSDVDVRFSFSQEICDGVAGQGAGNAQYCSFEKLDSVTYYDVTVYGPGNEVAIATDKASSIAQFKPLFHYVEDWACHGWYTDPELTEPFAESTLTAPISLYGDWQPAVDQTIYYEGDYNYVYYWSSVSGGNSGWDATIMTELTRHYETSSKVWSATIKGEYLADMVIFHSDVDQDQTSDLQMRTLPGVYGDEGILSDSSDKLAALAFLDAFDKLRDDNGDICGILEDSAKYEEVMDLYNAIQDHSLVDNLKDLGAAIKEGDEYVPTDVTIGETMNYLLVTRGTDVGTGAGLIGSFQKNASDWIAIVSIAAVSVAAAGLFFFIRKKKSAK